MLPIRSWNETVGFTTYGICTSLSSHLPIGFLLLCSIHALSVNAFGRETEKMTFVSGFSLHLAATVTRSTWRVAILWFRVCVVVVFLPSCCLAHGVSVVALPALHVRFSIWPAVFPCESLTLMSGAWPTLSCDVMA